MEPLLCTPSAYTPLYGDQAVLTSWAPLLFFASTVFFDGLSFMMNVACSGFLPFEAGVANLPDLLIHGLMDGLSEPDAADPGPTLMSLNFPFPSE